MLHTTSESILFMFSSLLLNIVNGIASCYDPDRMTSLSHQMFFYHANSTRNFHHSHKLMRLCLTANEYKSAYSIPPINIHEQQTPLCLVIYCVHMQCIILSLSYLLHVDYHIACLLTAESSLLMVLITLHNT